MIARQPEGRVKERKNKRTLPEKIALILSKLPDLRIQYEMVLKYTDIHSSE